MRIRILIATLLAAITLSGCAAYEQGGIFGDGGVVDATIDRTLGKDVTLVEAAIMVDYVRTANPDLGEFDTRLAAYAAIDVIRARNNGLLSEEEARLKVLEIVSSMAD